MTMMWTLRGISVRVVRSAFRHRISTSALFPRLISHHPCLYSQHKSGHDDFFGIEYDCAELDRNKWKPPDQPNVPDVAKMLAEEENPTESTDQPGVSEVSVESGGSFESGVIGDAFYTDKILLMNFGSIRLDSMNLPHEIAVENRDVGQTHREDSKSVDDESSLGYVDQQYFKTFTQRSLDETVSDVKDQFNGENQSTEDNQSELTDRPRTEHFQVPSLEEDPTNIDTKSGDNFFDEQIVIESNWTSQKTNTEDVSVRPMAFEDDDLNMFDQQIMSDSSLRANEPAGSVTQLNKSNRIQLDVETAVGHEQKPEDLNLFDEQLFGCYRGRQADMFISPRENKTEIESRTESETPSRPKLSRSNLMERESVDTKTVSSMKTELETSVDDVVVSERKRKSDLPPANLERPETAYDLSRRIRAEESGKLEGEEDLLDSKGGRLLSNQVPDWSRMPYDVITNVLKHAVIYNDNDVLAIDKPYGLSTQGGAGVDVSIDSLLPRLAALLDNDLHLHQVHRLDRNTTGVMLFAKTVDMQKRLIDMFRERRVRKRYWVLTKGVPTPTAGIIDIPIVETTIDGRYRMALLPDDPVTRGFQRKSSLESMRAVTKYRVLDSRNSAALVECEPVTGVKHQVRCHLGFALNCPVLGDHKYSHLTKIAPQRLYPETLQHLGVRQSKVRHLPLHIHSSSIVLPKLLDGRPLVVRARLPRHFVQNMKCLKIKVPKSR